MAIFRWFLSDVAGGKNEPRKASCIFVQCLFLEVLDLKTHGKLMQYSFNFASEISGTKTHLCQGLNSHYFHIIGDGHQPNSRGLYTHYKDSRH